MKQLKTALITGATAGIGRAIAEVFAEQGINLILTGRREERLEEIKSELEKKFGIKVTTGSFDIQNPEECKHFFEGLQVDLQSPDILVNNAGLAAGLSSIFEGDISDWERMIDTNIKGLLYITRLFSPEMIKAGKGHIINIGSIAGKETYDKGNVYCGTKHMVDALNKSMRREFAPFGIRVTGIHPGAVETEFSLVRFNGNREKATAVYQGFDNLLAKDIAEAVWFSVSRPGHVCINDLIIMPTAQPAAGVIHRN